MIVVAKELLFSLTKKDFVVQTFRAGGKGGQKQNKCSTGVRIIHPASGATGEARDSRSQKYNKRNALIRLTEDPKFKKWHKLECARRNGQLAMMEAWVEEQMQDKYLKIEYIGENAVAE